MEGKRIRFAAVVLGLCAAGLRLGSGAETLYVAPDGSERGTGRIGAPFATLEQARDAIRKMKGQGGLPPGGVTVVVREGAYARATAFALSAEDSGAAEAPVVYRAQAGATVRITGGRRIERFRKVAEAAVLDRLDAVAREHVVEADLKALGLSDFGQLAERGFGKSIRRAQMELFFNDRPMTLARWPNEGYATIAGLPEGEKSRRFQYEGDRPRRWAGEPDVWVYGYWYHDWADTYLPVESIDLETRVITTKSQHGYGLRQGNRWYALNALSELDSPGEHYIDRQRGVLLFWPPEPIESGNALVSVAEQLITIRDASHVTIRGFTLEACRGTAVEVSGGSHNQIVGCTLRNIGNRGVTVSGSDHAVVGCDIYETGDGGIALSGGDRTTLTPARLLAENNHVYNYSRWCRTYRPAVAVGGCGNVVRHNVLHHGPHNAIQLSGNDHRIEFNEIHDVCHDTGDVGAFYMGRDWTARGTVIRHNYWHDIRGPGRIGAMGVYLDDQASGITVDGNVFHRVTRAVFIGGGCDHVVENNVFVDCEPAVHIDARGLGWQKKDTDDPNGTLRSGLRSVPYRNELWANRYPNLVNILDDDPGTPKRNRIVRNVCVGGKWEDIDAATRKFQAIENNLTDQDPQFVDSDVRDFRLKSSSPAFRIGFRPIPVERIGLYEDERRASWPVVVR